MDHEVSTIYLITLFLQVQHLPESLGSKNSIHFISPLVWWLRCIQSLIINLLYCLVYFSSKFADIFDEKFFVYALRNHVNVVRTLPEDVLQRFDNNISNIINLRVKGWSSSTYYLQKVLPKLLELGYVTPCYWELFVICSATATWIYMFTPN